MKRVEQMRAEISKMADEEATKLYRLARKASEHGCSKSLVSAIRSEANWLHTAGKAYPEQILEWDFEYLMKYAFKM